MSADNDGDSQMLSSSPEDSDSQTPLANSALLSPPESQQQRTTAAAAAAAAMPTSASAAGANANGKRPINTISNGADEVEELDLLQHQQQQQEQQANGRTRADFPTKEHERSGYRWNRDEDTPGYAWLNKKAVDEYHRAWDSLAHREYMLKARFGDPFEIADREQAVINSLKQQ